MISAPPPLPLGELRQLGRELSNWGRWGAEDERGTLNLITPDRVARASRMVRRGARFCLSLPVDENGPYDQRTSGRFNPIRRMTGYRGDTHRGEFFQSARFAEDMLITSNHSGTHVDALAHCWYDGKIYNGFDAAPTVTSWGAQRCGVEVFNAGIMARAVLLDLPRSTGIDYLEPGTIIGPSGLEDALDATDVEVQPGDVLLVRTGTYPAARRGIDTGKGHHPGLSWECARWFREHEVAMVCADNFAVETTMPIPGSVEYPLHMLCLRDMGMPLGELFDLEELAQDCFDTGEYSCLLVAAPLNQPGATGSPLTPIAVK